MSAAGDVVVVESTLPLTPEPINYRALYAVTRATGDATRVDLGPGGQPATSSGSASITADGHFVVFEGYVPAAGQGLQVYRRDLVSGATWLVATTSGGVALAEGTNTPRISADGRFVAFRTESPDVDVAPTDVGRTWYRKNLVSGTTSPLLPATHPIDAQSVELSNDGRYVLFTPVPAAFYAPIYLLDSVTGVVTLASPSETADAGEGSDPHLSGDGRYVYFASERALLASLPSGTRRVFRFDRATQVLQVLPQPPDTLFVFTTQGSAVSVDGDRFTAVAYSSEQVAQHYLWSQAAFEWRMLSVRPDGLAGAVGAEVAPTTAFSANGNLVLFGSAAADLVPGDSGAFNYFVRDVAASATSAVVNRDIGTQANGPSGFPFVAQRTVSDDKRFVAYSSQATNLLANDATGGVHALLFDRQSRIATSVARNISGSRPNAPARIVGMSGNGRYVAFFSTASDIVPGDTSDYDFFLFDREAGITRRINETSAGQRLAIAPFGTVALDRTGRFVVVQLDTDLAAEDSNGATDCYRRDMLSGSWELASATQAGSASGCNTYPMGVAISEDGRHVAFVTATNGVVPEDANSLADGFVRDLQTRTTRWATPSENPTPNGGGIVRSTAGLSADGSVAAFVVQGNRFSSAACFSGRSVLVRNFVSRSYQRVQPLTGEDAYLAASAPLLAIAGAPSCDFALARTLHIVDTVDDYVTPITVGGVDLDARDISAPYLTPDGTGLHAVAGDVNVDATDTNGFQDVFLIELGVSRLVDSFEDPPQ